MGAGMKRIFITATNTNIGKTYTTKLLLREFASRGLKVGVFKPIETGVLDEPQDAKELLLLVKELNHSLWSLDIDDIAPITYSLAASPFVASQNTPLDLKKIISKLEELESFCDIVIIEGAGGLFVPIDENTMMIDLIVSLRAHAVLVTHCSLGCINDTLLSKYALERRNIPHKVIFNCRDIDNDFSHVSEPYFKKIGFRILKTKENIDTICDVLYNTNNK